MNEQNEQMKPIDTPVEEAALVLRPLIDEGYSYENLLSNPVLKPISEVDKRNMDLDEMKYKALFDIKSERQWINSVLLDIPEYQDNQFFNKLANLAEKSQNIIKIQDLQIKNYRDCIKEIYNLVKERYGVLIEEPQREKTAIYDSVETKIPLGNYRNYLNSLINNEEVKEIVEKIIDLYETDKDSKDEKKRFENACVRYYKDEVDKKKKDFAVKIMKMEVK